MDPQPRSVYQELSATIGKLWATYSEELVGDIGEKIAHLVDLFPKLDVATRWSSTYYMIERACKLQKGLDRVTANIKELPVYEMQEENCMYLVEVINFLEPP